MGNVKRMGLLLLALWSLGMKVNAQPNTELVRYRDPLFQKIQTDTGIKYAQAVNLYGRTQDLLADVYQPAQDTITKRPVVIFMHGGAFVSGSRKDDYVVEFCRQFAARGYVTISLQYRLGVTNMYNPIDYGDAIYRSVQDARAAVRYFTANAWKYGLDPDKIYIGGGSAGAITALHTAYWRQKDVPNYLSTGKLGALDATGDYKNTPVKVKGVINCWGALVDTACMQKGDAPVVSIHGEADPVVPYKTTGMGIFNLYGSYYVHQTARQRGIYSVLQSFPNAGHGFSRSDTGKWDTTISTIRDFLLHTLTPPEIKEPPKKDSTPTDTAHHLPADTSANSTGLAPGSSNLTGGWQLYPNPITTQFTLVNTRDASLSRLEILNLAGQLTRTWTQVQPGAASRQYEVDGLPAGIYLLRMQWQDGRTATQKLNVGQ